VTKPLPSELNKGILGFHLESS
jgi:exosome complex RNA-binding protein Rrp42 (RNase PH superfamily)